MAGSSIHRRLLSIGLGAILSVGALACGSSDQDAPTVTESGQTSEAGSGDDEIPACDSFNGQPTETVADYFNEGNPCAADIGLDEPETTFVGLGNEECADGTFLYWNDQGWGATAGTWTATIDGLPPDDAFDTCRGE
jgi:hypothetical protein